MKLLIPMLRKLLPAGSVLGDDGNGHFVNEFTQDPQTVTFVYYIDQDF